MPPPPSAWFPHAQPILDQLDDGVFQGVLASLAPGLLASADGGWQALASLIILREARVAGLSEDTARNLAGGICYAMAGIKVRLAMADRPAGERSGGRSPTAATSDGITPG